MHFLCSSIPQISVFPSVPGLLFFKELLQLQSKQHHSILQPCHSSPLNCNPQTLSGAFSAFWKVWTWLLLFIDFVCEWSKPPMIYFVFFQMHLIMLEANFIEVKLIYVTKHCSFDLFNFYLTIWSKLWSNGKICNVKIKLSHNSGLCECILAAVKSWLILQRFRHPKVTHAVWIL